MFDLFMAPFSSRLEPPQKPGRFRQEIVPLSLRNAIHSFVLACAARELRGQGGEHSSMLIHVTRYVAVQDHVREQVEETVRRMRQRITRNEDADELLAQLRKLWDEDFVSTRDTVFALSPTEERPPALPAWDDLVAKLPYVLGDIVVRSINGTAKDALDYATPGAALKVIAVGGDKLARGLTLEGLCTSYFVRTTKMYDTLMQMGRWFGYRPGYLDLCRLYTSTDLVRWFGHIADASEELREEFDFMAKANLTPEQYGLKVMSHEILTVTSPLKMRNAQTLSLTYSGTHPQTILFHRYAKIQKANLDATDALIASLGMKFVDAPKYPRDGEAESWPGARLWQDVDAPKVLAFLGAYETHPNADRAKAAVLADFISKMIDIEKLKQWSVALLTGGDGVGETHVFPGDFEVNSFQTRKTEDPDPPDIKDLAMFAIGVLTDPKDEGIDLDDDVWRDALARTRAAWKPDPARNRVNLPSAPSGKGIRESRDRLGGEADRGLLLLYTLAPYYKGKAKLPENLIVPDWDKPIMAFAIAFPSCENGVQVEYEVNLLYWKQEYGPAE
ncbi:Z1 domain-containing protein [Thiomonas sp.]